MPGRRGRLTPGEFHDLKLAKEMAAEYNRYAEAVNKQIQRLKKSGVNYGNVLTAEQMKPFKVFRKNKKGHYNVSKSRLESAYKKLFKQAPDYTQKAVKKMQLEKEDIAKMLGRKKLTAGAYQSLRELTRRASSERALFYQIMRTANDVGVIEDFKLPDELDGMSTEAAEKWLVDAINEELETGNKQRRVSDDVNAWEKEKAFYRRRAWDFERTTGQDRLNAGRFRKMTAAEQKALQDAFGIK